MGEIDNQYPLPPHIANQDCSYSSTLFSNKERCNQNCNRIAVFREQGKFCTKYKIRNHLSLGVNSKAFRTKKDLYKFDTNLKCIKFVRIDYEDTVSMCLTKTQIF